MATDEPILDFVSDSPVSKSELSKTASVSASVSQTPFWGPNPVPLKDFALKKIVPGFAKIVKGNYMTLGSSKFSLSKQHQEVFIHSVRMAVKILAHSVRRVEATSVSKRSGHTVVSRMYAVDQRLSVPISYQGWFELLSEDGKSARPITTVHELSKVKPKRCLVRENTKAFVIHDENKLSFDKSRIVLAGEHLVLSGELTVPSSDDSKKVKLLRCFDSKGDRIYLSFEQKCLFTPIANENDLTGVFHIRDIVRKFRLPLTVKLVQGMRPKVDPARFTGLIRLDWVYTEETAFVCPIEKNQIRLLPVPTDANLQLVAAVNHEDMLATELYHSMTAKCNRMISNYNTTIHLIVNLPDAASKGKGKKNSNMFSGPLTKHIEQTSNPRSEKKQNRLMDEIDDLYGYVRDGGIVPKFQYDSDEESFWEEPAYEPLDDFRARLNALEAGEKVTYHTKYQPQELGTLDLIADANQETDSTYGVLNGGPRLSQGNILNPQPPPLPPRQAEVPPTLPVSHPPDIPTRRQSFTSNPNNSRSSLYLNQATPIESPVKIGPPYSGQRPPSYHRQASAQRQRKHSHGSGGDSKQRRHSRGSGEPVSSKRETGSNSGSSGHGHQLMLARDFKDSDISSVTKGSSGSSGGPVGRARKKLQTLYL